MQKKSLERRRLVSFALIAVFLAGSCKKNADAPGIPVDSISMGSLSTSNAASVAPTVYSINSSTIRHDDGHAYKTGPISNTGDSNEKPTRSTLKLYENGVALGPAHIAHNDIRDIGRGAFSHWGPDLYFSASDNSSPINNGRKYTYTLTRTAASAPSGSGSSTAPVGPVLSTELTGYASVGSSTRGGKGGKTVTVASFAAFKAAVASNTPKVVYVGGTIKGTGYDPVYVGSNTTLIGKTGAVLQGMNLYLFTVNNVIIQNITFKNYVQECGVYIKFKSHHIWVDHCDFSTDRSHGWDYWGKDIGVAEGADFVTISWNRFHDTNLSVLIGSVTSDAAATNTGKLRVTFHHNFWYNIGEREPTLMFGSIHMYNNYHLNNSGYSIGARYRGTVRTDNEYFSGCKKPLTTNLDGDPVGYFSGTSTNIYSNCGANNITTSLSKWVPGYPYLYLLNAAENVPGIVKAGAGPKTL
ncbi:pectate lyase [Mucilaginibacter sp.]|uniref:pectate lyase family protein n=1 Tax=Mucilaginibacter sp. TaxID=1882438 RepID=UPI00262C95E0|nr:pectate lyase [Mucilaginibacter sp.]MDB4919707.1 Pectate lyase [Mucilaginibacter sp.]